MANSLSYLNPSFWAKEVQKSLFVENTAMLIANTRLVNLLAGEGATAYRTILSYPSSGTYTPGSDITNQTLTSSSESLTVSTWLAAKVTVDDTEKKQSIIDIGSTVAERMMKRLNNVIEQAVLAQITNAKWSLDDGNVGGTSGSNISLNTSNIPQVFTAADTKLDATDCGKYGRVAVVGTHFLNLLKLQQAGRATSFGDQVNANGLVGRLFGYDIVFSNNLPWTAAITIATNPTAGDTITIAGVTFTFADTLSVAGNLHICSDAANTVANMVVAFNAPKTAIAEATNTGYQVISAEDAFMFADKRSISAVATSATVTTLSGYGDIVVSETLTAAADVWSAQRQDSFFGMAGAVDQIVQIPPKIEVVRDPDQFADIVKCLLGYGVKTFADGAREMVRVKINAGTSDWA